MFYLVVLCCAISIVMNLANVAKEVLDQNLPNVWIGLYLLASRSPDLSVYDFLKEQILFRCY